jgi:hypothetical protein
MRNGKECRRNRGDKNVEKKRELFRAFFHFILPRTRSFSCALEFYEDRHIQPVLGLAKIWQPGICSPAVASGETAEANQ